MVKAARVRALGLIGDPELREVYGKSDDARRALRRQLEETRNALVHGHPAASPLMLAVGPAIGPGIGPAIGPAIGPGLAAGVESSSVAVIIEALAKVLSTTVERAFSASHTPSCNHRTQPHTLPELQRWWDKASAADAEGVDANVTVRCLACRSQTTFQVNDVRPEDAACGHCGAMLADAKQVTREAPPAPRARLSPATKEVGP